MWSFYEKLQFVKGRSCPVCRSMPSSSPCLVWDFFGPFSQSARDNGHIMQLRVRQNICHAWSRLITPPVEVGGPVVSQYASRISSFGPCFGGRSFSIILFRCQHQFPDRNFIYFLCSMSVCGFSATLVRCLRVSTDAL